MPNLPVDTGLVLAMKTRARRYPDLGKIITKRKVPAMTGGLAVVSISLPAITMHLAALKANGRQVRRVR